MRFAANLLYQYRVVGDPRRRVTCEKRIVVVRADTPRDALDEVKRRAKSGEHSYKNAYGQMVRIEFLGIIDLIDLEACEPDEVWFALFEAVEPSRRLRAFVPRERDLSVFRDGAIGRFMWAVPKGEALPSNPPLERSGARMAARHRSRRVAPAAQRPGR